MWYNIWSCFLLFPVSVSPGLLISPLSCSMCSLPVYGLPLLFIILSLFCQYLLYGRFPVVNFLCSHGCEGGQQVHGWAVCKRHSLTCGLTEVPWPTIIPIKPMGFSFLASVPCFNTRRCLWRYIAVKLNRFGICLNGLNDCPFRYRRVRWEWTGVPRSGWVLCKHGGVVLLPVC